MHYFRKKSSSSSTPVNSRRTLAASSSAIALSIVCEAWNPSDVALNEPGSSKESAWKTAYEAAKITIEESSDLSLPLKAVVGALSVLIKNCDQTFANAEQINDIEERIESLSEILAFPAGHQDTEEMARRTALRKKLVRIVTVLRPLSEQHGLAKFLKNDDHANSLNGFVQDLAYAVADYQTSIQQGIHKNTKKIEETPRTTRRIEEATRRIEEATKRSGGATERIDNTTQGIVDAAEGFDQTTEEVDHTTNKIDGNIRTLVEAADLELELLGKLEPVMDAGHHAGHHDVCFHGTRESVLDWIMRWARDPQERHVFWLNGLAGTGKSTIAQTFSEMATRNGTLGASFFCSRDYLDRKELKNIFPTLAYQLACQHPELRRRIIRVIENDPSVAHSSLISQLERLVVDPLSSTGISCTIVIDALDECVDDQPSSTILSALGRHVNDLQSVKFFITGRPESHIRSGFSLPSLEPLTQVFLLHEVEQSSVDEDIRLYLQEKLGAIAKRSSDLDLPDVWPSDDDLTALTKKSSGLFISASTLVRFIESEHHEPKERLRLITTFTHTPLEESVWKTTYGVAKIAIETVKESSDLSLPLKAVVGALSALSVLVKIYDHTIANAKQINDIGERIESLSEILAFSVGDQDTEEMIRRIVLKKKLVRIITELRPLSEQRGLAEFLKSDDYADRLNGFVQDLAYAVADYQTPVQQSVYENTERIAKATRIIEEVAMQGERPQFYGNLHQNTDYSSQQQTSCYRVDTHDGHLQPTVDPTSGLSTLVDHSMPAYKRLISGDFSPQELISLIGAIFTSKDEVRMICNLCGDDAQTFIDVIHEALGLPDLPPRLRSKCLSALCRICGSQALLPRSLQIPSCYSRSGNPSYQGGFADVWKGKHEGLSVAVKALRIYAGTDFSKIASRFCKEVVTWNILRHPNVLPLLGVSMGDNQLAMVSEWMDYGNINEFVKTHWDANRFELLKDVTTGLMYMHGQGMVHGDLKGANILVDQSGHARLTDFGLLTIVSDPTNFTPSSFVSPGGTTRWMSPELLLPDQSGSNDSRPTVESDCYALGMVIYEVLSGQAPFAQFKGVVAAQKVIGGERPERPGGAAGALFADDLWELLGLCWTREPKGRPSIEVVFTTLDQVSGTWVPPPPQVDEEGESDEITVLSKF